MYQIKYIDQNGHPQYFQTIAQTNREAVAKCKAKRNVHQIVSTTRNP